MTCERGGEVRGNQGNRYPCLWRLQRRAARLAREMEARLAEMEEAGRGL